MLAERLLVGREFAADDLDLAPLAEREHGASCYASALCTRKASRSTAPAFSLALTSVRVRIRRMELGFPWPNCELPMSPRRCRFALVVLVVLMGGAFASAAPARVPDEADQAKALKLIRELFKNDYAKKRPADQTALAHKLLDQARDTKDDLVARFVLFCEAKELAVQAGDFSLALQAIEEAAEEYAVNGTTLKTEVLKRAAATAMTAAAQKALLDAMFGALDSALISANFEGTDELVAIVEGIVKKAANAALATMATNQLKDFTAARKAAETLIADPTDTAANAAMGRYLCFVRGDWDKGLRLLAAGDGKTRDLAKQDLSAPSVIIEQIALADGWWDLAEVDAGSKRAAARRAGFWYKKALPKLSGLTKTKVEGRLKDLDKVAPPEPPRAIARWTFARDTRDSIGSLHGTLKNGAVVANGRLRINGKGGYFVVRPKFDLGPRTLEAWIVLPNLQTARAVPYKIGDDQGTWDGISYSELQPKKWFPGSSFRHRSQSLDGPEENARPAELIHIAIAYAADNSIAMYRNGKPYGSPFTPHGPQDKLQTYKKGSFFIAMGGEGDGAFEIEEARLYDRALSADEVIDSFHAGITKRTTP
jgi:hypothetical protein